MKKYFIWTFERGSRPYDIICAVILAFIFLTPRSAFNDLPDYMRVDSPEPVRKTVDDNGNTVFTVKLDARTFGSEDAARAIALARLRESTGERVKVSKMIPVHDTMGALVAFSVWTER
jgi:hypothetical protein